MHEFLFDVSDDAGFEDWEVEHVAPEIGERSLDDDTIAYCLGCEESVIFFSEEDVFSEHLAYSKECDLVSFFVRGFGKEG